MSPEITTRALLSYIDLLPMHKIFGFGGDYQVVEKVYGHLQLAKRDIARALAEKINRYRCRPPAPRRGSTPCCTRIRSGCFGWRFSGVGQSKPGVRVSAG